MRRHISIDRVLIEGGGEDRDAFGGKGTKGLFSLGGCNNGGQAFYRRDELSVGKGSDPKLVRFPWFSFFFAGSHSSCSKLLLHFFFPVCFPGHLD